jgi:hypothetical protein
MSIFQAAAMIPTEIQDLAPVVEDVQAHFSTLGFQVSVQPSTGGSFISLSKGGVFKAVLGMKSALNITLARVSGGVTVNASVGIFGQQLLPSLISMFVAWPVLIPQIMGMVKQSKLDDEAVRVITESIRRHETTIHTVAEGFCTACGATLPLDAAFCSKCGARQA